MCVIVLTRPGAGRKPGVPNKITNTFRDLVMQAATEVGDSCEKGKDGQGGVLGYLKVAAVEERKIFLMIMARILPLKMTAELKQFKKRISIEEAVAELKAVGLDEMLALYLKRYPLEPGEEEEEWAQQIDMTLAPDPFVDVTLRGNVTGSDTESE
jgi:hypothetical protein